MENNDLTGAASLANLDLNGKMFSSTGDGSLNPEAFSEETKNVAIEANKAVQREKEEAEKKAASEFNYRGKNTYNNIVSANVSAPYVKADGTNKKFPYLSSKHHIGRIFDPMESSIRNTNAMTVAEERKATQDRMLGGDFAEEGQGTRGSSYFGNSFDKDSEKEAKVAVKKHEYLLNAASKGEQSLKAALDPNREVKNKFGVTVKVGSLVDELFPIDKRSGTNLDGSYAAKPSGQSLRSLNTFKDLENRASGAQDLVDDIRGYESNMTRFMANRKPFTMKRTFDTRSGN
mgnify:CR=1 FL=1